MGCTPVVHHVCCAVQVLDQWNKGELDSFLIEITANILKYKDTDGKPLVEKIKDSAGQVCGWRGGVWRVGWWAEGRGVASGMVGGGAGCGEWDGGREGWGVASGLVGGRGRGVARGWMGRRVGHVMSHDCPAERNWQVDCNLCTGQGHSCHAHWSVTYACTHTVFMHTLMHTQIQCTYMYTTTCFCSISSLFPSHTPSSFAGESVFARCLSSLKEERTQASKILKGPSSKFQEDKKAFVEHIRRVSDS